MRLLLSVLVAAPLFGCGAGGEEFDNVQTVARQVAIAVCDASEAADDCLWDYSPDFCTVHLQWDSSCLNEVEQEVLRNTEFDPDITPRLAELCIEEMQNVTCLDVEYSDIGGCFAWRGPFYDACDLD